jgi:hypothetical protein
MTSLGILVDRVRVGRVAEALKAKQAIAMFLGWKGARSHDRCFAFCCQLVCRELARTGFGFRSTAQTTCLLLLTVLSEVIQCYYCVGTVPRIRVF